MIYISLLIRKKKKKLKIKLKKFSNLFIINNMSWRVKLRMKYLTGILNNYRISSLNDTEKFELFIIDNENFSATIIKML